MKMQQKKKFKKDDILSDIEFCTECGSRLDDFSIDNLNDKNQIYERFCECKKSGKFKGNYCSKLFIIENNENDILNDDDFSNPEFPEDD